MAKFNKLDVPHQWKDEFTKYPHGYTIFEALCNWTKQVDNMVDNINNWNDYLDNFVLTFDVKLQEEVQSTIEKWQSEGLLDDIIESALNTELDSINIRITNVDNSKRDKSVKITSSDLDTSTDASKIKLLNLSEEVQAAMAGTAPVISSVADGSLTTEKYANGSITKNKLSFPSIDSVALSYGKENFILNESEGSITFGKASLINVAYSDNTVLQSDVIPTGTKFTFAGSQSLVMDLSTKVLNLVPNSEIPTNTVVLVKRHATLGFYDGHLYWQHVAETKHKYNKFGLLYSSDGVPDFDFNTGVLVLKRPRLCFDGKWYVVSDETVTISLDVGIYVYGIIMLDIENMTFSVKTSATIEQAKNTEVLIALFNTTNQLVYMAGAYTINGKQPNYGDDDPDTTLVSKSSIWGDFKSIYIDEVSVSMEETLTNMTITDIYDEYDSLVSSYPNNVSRNLIGYGSTNTGEEDLSLPIYEYVFKPSQDINDSLSETPVMLIQTGTHGNEKSTVYSTLTFCKELMENIELEDIKNNVCIKVVPITNPGGFNDNTRNNRNDVNLNRNYQYQWSKATDEDKGSAPLSEPETQATHDWMLANSEAIFYTDFHNSLSETTSYTVTMSEYMKKLYSSVIRRISKGWRNRFNIGPTTRPHGQIIDIWSNGWSIQDAYHIAGIENTLTLEVGYKSASDDSTIYDEIVMKRGTELLTNVIKAVINAQ